jgi:hypothetical protein
MILLHLMAVSAGQMDQEKLQKISVQNELA